MGKSPSDALRIAKKNRPRVSPSPEQLDALIEWSRHERNERGEPPYPDTWNDLAQIAYHRS